MSINLAQIEKLLTLTQETVSSSNFMFEKIINLMMKLQAKYDKAIEDLETTYANLIERMRKDHGGHTEELMADFKNETAKIKQEFEGLSDSLKDMIEARLVLIKDGKDADEIKIIKEVLAQIPPVELDTPETIRDKLERLTGENRLDMEAIRGWDDEIKKLTDKIEEIKRGVGNTRIGRFFGGTPHNLLQTIDVSSQINGTTREFTGLPTARFYPFVFSSQSPFILLPTAHYTIGRNAITIGNNLEIPQSGTGAYLFVAYIK